MKKIWLLFSLACLWACEDGINTENVYSEQSVVDEHFISATKAVEIALNNPLTVSTKSMKGTSKKILNTIREVLDSIYNPLYYVINFDNNGFAIVAADDRITSVLAYSDHNSFPITTENSPEALREWLNSIERKIVNIRYFNGGINRDKIVVGDTIKVPKYPSDIGGTYPGDIGGGNIGGTYPGDIGNGDPDLQLRPPSDPFNRLYVAPFIKTTWSQENGFNRFMPPCATGIPVPAGCVAIAMAQIMKYYEYPASYSWDKMPLGYSSSVSARLIKDIGRAVKMDYDCSGSSADTETAVVPAFLKTFGYSSAKYSGFDPDKVRNNLKYKMPVIFRGGRKKKIIGLIPVYADGHAWVCCGFNESYIEIPPGSLAEEGEKWYYHTRYYYMNWGWGGSYDGWYTSWNPNGNDFNYKCGIVYNIKP